MTKVDFIEKIRYIKITKMCENYTDSDKIFINQITDKGQRDKVNELIKELIDDNFMNMEICLNEQNDDNIDVIIHFPINISISDIVK